MRKLQNWDIGITFSIPENGTNVWLWDDGATSNTAHSTRVVDQQLEVFLGLYVTTAAGYRYLKENTIYLNQCGGNHLSYLLERFTQKDIDEHFKRIWHSAHNVSLANSRIMLARPMTRAELLEKIRMMNQPGVGAAC